MRGGAKGWGMDASIIIAAWRAAEFIGPSIHSALAQTGVTLEVIVVDDASDDGGATVAAAQAAANGDERVRVISASKNGGPGGARNLGFEAARGQWLVVLDSDDTMEPGRVATLIGAAKDWPADVALDNLKLVDGEGRSAERGVFLDPDEHSELAELTLAQYINENRPFQPVKRLGFLKPIVSRAFLERHGLAYEAALRNGEDYRLIADILAVGGRVILHPMIGYRYTAREGSISHRLKPQHVQALLASEDAYWARYRQSMDPQAAAAWRSRRQALKMARRYVSAMEALKARRFPAAFAQLARSPAAAIRVVGDLAKKLAGARSMRRDA